MIPLNDPSLGRSFGDLWPKRSPSAVGKRNRIDVCFLTQEKRGQATGIPNKPPPATVFTYFYAEDFRCPASKCWFREGILVCEYTSIHVYSVRDAEKADRPFRQTRNGRSFVWQGRQDSNPQPPVLETGALPVELLP